MGATGRDGREQEGQDSRPTPVESIQAYAMGTARQTRNRNRVRGGRHPLLRRLEHLGLHPDQGLGAGAAVPTGYTLAGRRAA